MHAKPRAALHGCPQGGARSYDEAVKNRPPSLLRLRGLAALLLALAGPALANDPNAARLYEDALQRYEKRDLGGAIVQLKNALRIDRRMLQVHLLLGRALLDSSDVIAAEVAFNEALRLGVDRAEVVVPLARAVLAQGQRTPLFQDARFALQGLPAPVQAELLLLLAGAHADLGRPREALQAIEQARALQPQRAASWLAEVPLRVRGGQFGEAATAAERAIALATGPAEPAEAQYLLGSVAHAQARLPQALEGYTRALRLQPEHLEALLGRAGIALDQGRTLEARIDITQARRQHAKDPRVVYLGALLAEREGDTQAARAALLEITQLIDPVTPAFLRYRPQLQILAGLAHHGLGQYAKARPHFEALQRADPGSPVARLLGQILLADDNPARAAEVLEAYLRARPGDSQALNLLAAAQMAQGRPARATELLQQALATRDDPLLRTQLGLSLARAGREAEALAPLQAAYARDPGQLTAGIALVQLHLAAQRPAQALAVAEALVQRQPQQAALHELLAQAHLQAGDKPRARQALEQALKLEPAGLSAPLALARLDVADGRLDAAQRRLQGLLPAHDKQPELLTTLGQLAERRGETAEATRWLAKAADHAGPRELGPLLNLVDFHLRGRRYSAAEEAARALNARAPQDARVQWAQARVALGLKNLDTARAALARASQLADADAPLQTGIALLQLAAQDARAASASLARALQADPAHLPALALQVDVDLALGALPQAEQKARALVARQPRQAVGHALLGDVARARGQLPAAIEAYRQALRLQPDTEALLRLFRAQAGSEPRAAVQTAEQWLATQPRDTAVRQQLADFLASRGQMAEARRQYETLLHQAPNQGVAWNNYAHVLLALKDQAGASRAAEAALSVLPEAPHVLGTAGWMAHHAGQRDRALQLLREARLRDPANPDTRYYLAQVLAGAGRPGEAREELHAALQARTYFANEADAQKLLQSLR